MKTIPNPKDNLATMALVVCLITIVLAAAVFFSVLVPPAFKTVIFAGTAIGLSALMLAPLPLLSTELRARIIGITLVTSFAWWWGVVIGNSSMTMALVGIAFLFVWLTMLEWRVYRFLGGKEELRESSLSFGLPKDSFPNARFSKESEHIRITAAIAATQMAQSAVGTEQLLLALISHRKTIAGKCLAQAGIKYDEAKRMLMDQLRLGEQQQKNVGAVRAYSVADLPSISTQTKDAVMLAVDWSHKLNAPEVKSEHLLLALLDTPDDGAHKLINSLKIDTENLRQSLLKSISS